MRRCEQVVLLTPTGREHSIPHPAWIVFASAAALGFGANAFAGEGSQLRAAARLLR
jgi:hypothetical protein